MSRTRRETPAASHAGEPVGESSLDADLLFDFWDAHVVGEAL
jgi:hypothetical protein